MGVCEACMKAKHKKSSHTGVGIRATQNLELVHTDLSGHAEVQGLSGARYFITFIDDHSRSIVEGSKSLLRKSKFAKRFWEQAVGVTVKIQNCLITSALDKKTPYELWHGRKPNLEKFRVFGCTCYVQVPKQKRRKFDDKSQKCVFMGYGSEGNEYKCWDPIAKKMLISSDVAFAERDIPGEQEGSDQDVDFMKSKEPELIWVSDAPAAVNAQGGNPAGVGVGTGRPGKGPAAAEQEMRQSGAEQETRRFAADRKFRRPAAKTVTEDRRDESESDSQDLVRYEPPRG
ncbi:hypothetical protein R1sor_010089 [Riccia sorocarpa]|uniref:Retroviral polymerase SH3-like domain-containing protein n=1 Tax=Riccia sorocarpa TaxID=122646 RepID=A0ABD3HX37_9MARC